MLHNLITLAIAGSAAALATWILVAILIRLAPRIGLVDRPNDRSLHTRVTPRGGGIGFVLAVLGGLLVLRVSSPGGAMSPATVFGALLGCAGFVAVISLWDDFRSLGAAVRFLTHSAAAGVTCWMIGSTPLLELPGFSPWSLGTGAGIALTALWIVGLTNVYNFMDGIDGIAGLQAVFAGFAWAIAGLWFDWPLAGILAALLAGACCGFLAHNWSPARIFMGDVGSAFLGYLFAVLPLLAQRDAGGEAASLGFVARLPVFAVLAVYPFFADGALTLVRRSLKREPVWKAHRSHLYQRLVQTGWTHARVSLLYGLWAALSVAVAWWWLVGGRSAAAIVWSFALGTLGLMFAFVSARERTVAARARKDE